jgi:hypothetical protein
MLECGRVGMGDVCVCVCQGASDTVNVRGNVHECK